jgi:hypothetical protein
MGGRRGGFVEGKRGAGRGRVVGDAPNCDSDDLTIGCRANACMCLDIADWPVICIIIPAIPQPHHYVCVQTLFRGCHH